MLCGPAFISTSSSFLPGHSLHVMWVLQHSATDGEGRAVVRVAAETRFLAASEATVLAFVAPHVVAHVLRYRNVLCVRDFGGVPFALLLCKSLQRLALFSTCAALIDLARGPQRCSAYMPRLAKIRPDSVDVAPK